MPEQSTATKRCRFHTPDEVAERWGVDRQTVIRALKSGKLRAVRLGNRGHYRIPVAEIVRVERGEILGTPNSAPDGATRA
jgi:excisionase family DNA binding protein